MPLSLANQNCPILLSGKLISEKESHQETEKIQKKKKEREAVLQKPKIVELT